MVHLKRGITKNIKMKIKNKTNETRYHHVLVSFFLETTLGFFPLGNPPLPLLAGLARETSQPAFPSPGLRRRTGP